MKHNVTASFPLNILLRHVCIYGDWFMETLVVARATVKRIFREKMFQ